MLDSYGRNITYMRLSVTDLCNLRCRYCMPADGLCKKSHDEMLTEDEMIQAVKIAAELGVNKLRITGGEPLVKKNILSICERSAAVPGIEKLCMTTNGVLLPDMASDLKKAGVEYMNISIDTLNPDKYSDITRIGRLSDALDGIYAALDTGFKKVKLNSVLIGGFNDDEIDSFAELTRRYPIDVRFIELMPMVNDSSFGPEAYIPGSTVLDRLPKAVPVKNEAGSVSRLYRLPDALGNIGLINPISDEFCGSCNRIRLTADGQLKPCLHSGSEYSIKGASAEEMREIFETVIKEKPACHPPLSAEDHSPAGRNMNEIGG